MQNWCNKGRRMCRISDFSTFVIRRNSSTLQMFLDFFTYRVYRNLKFLHMKDFSPGFCILRILKNMGSAYISDVVCLMLDKVFYHGNFKVLLFEVKCNFSTFHEVRGVDGVHKCARIGFACSPSPLNPRIPTFSPAT